MGSDDPERVGDRNGETEYEDQILDNIGDFGQWQLRYFFLACLITLPTAWPSLSNTFLNASTDYWCARPTDTYVNYDNVTFWRESSSPLVLEAGEMVRDKCNVWDSASFTRPNDNATTNCTSWEYDRSRFTNTLTQQFDLVCDRHYHVSNAQSVFFAGLMIGVFAAGWAADFIGRKKALYPFTFGMALFGTISAFMPNIESFIAIRFLHGCCTIGVFAVAFVWCMEIVGGKWQTIIGIGFEGPWVVGWFLLALIAWIAPDWRHIQLITSVPSFLCVVGVWFLPESPKWLLSMGRVSSAEKIVRQAVKMNGQKDLPADWKLTPIHKKDDKRYYVFHLFCSKNLAMKTIILYINWFANSFVYYGLTLNSGKLNDNLMIQFLLNGLMEIPAYSFSLWILLKRGRKVPYVTMMMIGGIALFCTMAVPKNAFPNNWPIVVLALIGKLMITGTFAIIYVYSAEIYPTVVRSVGVGSSSTFARIGGMVAPYIGNLADTYGPTFPITIFGITAFVAGILAIFLPETQNRKLPDTLQEGEEVKVSWKDGVVKFST